MGSAHPTTIDFEFMQRQNNDATSIVRHSYFCNTPRRHIELVGGETPVASTLETEATQCFGNYRLIFWGRKTVYPILLATSSYVQEIT